MPGLFPSFTLLPGLIRLALIALFFSASGNISGQGTGYWDQKINSEAALLSGAVVAGESSIAAIYYNPATITEMTRNNLSLSANLFSVYKFKADNALGEDFPADRTQFDVYPRIITLTMNPVKYPGMTVELAYFTKSNSYLKVDKGTSLSTDIIESNPGTENYAAEYYLRSQFQDYYGGAGFGFKVSESLAIGYSLLISYKDDQYHNIITANAFAGDFDESEPGQQYLSSSSFEKKFSMYDVRMINKVGIHYRKKLFSFGTNITLPSIKLFGDGKSMKQISYSNIHLQPGNMSGTNRFESGRQDRSIAHFRDPLSIAAGMNYYTPSGRSVILFTAEYFFGMDEYEYIEASNDPGEDGYSFSDGSADDWLTYKAEHRPVLNAGIAFKKNINDRLMVSGGFRTDFSYLDPESQPDTFNHNERINYPFNVFHLNSGFGYSFERGSIIMGMQFTHGGEKNQKQVINLTNPVEYIDETIMPLTGYLNNNVAIKFNELSVYIGFMFNFMKGSGDQ